MKKLYTILAACLAAAGLITSPEASAKANVLTLSCELPSENLIMPESMEMDTRDMLDGWYIQKFAVVDSLADSRPEVQVTDEQLIERLSKLPTEIEMPFNSVVKAAILKYADIRQYVENMLALSLYYMPIFDTALDRYDLPKELRYLAIVESALNPSAVSKAGAVGLWQFMSPTASGLGLENNSLVDERRDPYASTDAAARYLKQLYGTFNDWSLAIAAYNCGPGNVNKALRRCGDGKHDFWDVYPFLPQETRNYFPSFIAVNYIMNYFGEHNIAPAVARRPVVIDTVHVTRRVYFKQISDVMEIPMDELKALNPQYKRDMIPGDSKPYPLALPSLQALAYIVNEDSIVNYEADKYARRLVVEPATDGVHGSDSKGEYIDELVTKYHTVKKGETLHKIANRYGVSVSSIRKLNKVGKNVKRGTRLKIQTYRRKYIEKPKEVADTVLQDTDSLAEVQTAMTDSVSQAGTGDVNTMLASAEEVKEEAKPAVPKTEKRKKGNAESTNYTTHIVKKGENLFKIATRHGITVDQLKAANGLTTNNIQVGQRLKVPRK